MSANTHQYDEPQEPAAQSGERETDATATNDTLDPVLTESRGATATNDALDPVPENNNDATATHDALDPVPEASSNEPDDAWDPNMTPEEFIAGIPLRDRLLMTWAGEAVQKRRNKF